jgi:hypothetical protein
VSIVRIVLWNIGDSHTTIEELRAKMPELTEPSTWLWNAAGERFGLIAFDEEIEAYDHARAVIGKEPEAVEEFET